MAVAMSSSTGHTGVPSNALIIEDFPCLNSPITSTVNAGSSSRSRTSWSSRREVGPTERASDPDGRVDRPQGPAAGRREVWCFGALQVHRGTRVPTRVEGSCLTNRPLQA